MLFFKTFNFNMRILFYYKKFLKLNFDGMASANENRDRFSAGLTLETNTLYKKNILNKIQ